MNPFNLMNRLMAIFTKRSSYRKPQMPAAEMHGHVPEEKEDSIKYFPTHSNWRTFAKWQKSAVTQVRKFSKQLQRRATERITVSVPVNYRMRDSRWKWAQAFACNISLDGISLMLNEKLFAGSEIELEMKLPEFNRMVSLKGIVIWSKYLEPEAEPYSVQCGIAFAGRRYFPFLNTL